MSWLYTIGSDSLSEGQQFSINEAGFFLRTLFQVATPDFSIQRWGAAIFLGAFTYLALHILSRQIRLSTSLKYKVKIIVGLGLTILPLIFTISHLQKIFVKTDQLAKHVNTNYTQQAWKHNIKNTNLDVVLYIGESTSILNMGLYGYIRPTTPMLSSIYSNNPNFLVFDNVLSTHSHTFNSLLDALSIEVGNQEITQLIEHKQQLPIPELLSHNNIKSFLISNQGRTGVSDLVNKAIFKSSLNRFSVAVDNDQSRATSNLVSALHRPYDHEFLIPTLETTLRDNSEADNNVIFLHSYAGHGSYYQNIPPDFRVPVDNYFRSMNPESIVGKNISLLTQIEEYDAAIRYIDHTLNSAIELITDRDKPTVLIYFSDHGESVFTGRGHDSSRFTHEMIRTPFIIYFNKSAALQYSSTLEQQYEYSNSDKVSTLAQLPDTLLEILGATTNDKTKGN